MYKTTAINLSGQLFNSNDDAYKVLQAYLEMLRTQLTNDKDRDEILQDFEQAIAGHLLEQLTDKQNVVTKLMVEKIVSEMGDYEPLDESANDPTPSSTESNNWQKFFKRPLYLDKDNSFIAGVCAGLGRSLEVEDVWIRLAFIVLTFLTQGFMILVYIVLMLTMKEPKNLSEQLQAEGRAPTAAALVAHSKKRFAEARDHLQKVDLQKDLEPVRSMMVKLFRIVAGIMSLVLVSVTTIFYISALVWWLGRRGNVPVIAYVPHVVVYAFFSSLFFVLMLPLVTLLVISVSHRAANARLNVKKTVMLLLPWLVALGVLASSVVLSVPHIIDWGKDHPNDKYFQLKVENNEIKNSCISLGGYCNDPLRNRLNFKLPPINSFEDCSQQYPLELTFPEQCRVPQGPVFVQPQ